MKIDMSAIREIAFNAHDGQFRRDGITPYIEHPRAVARRFPHDPLSEAIAWLHDVIEDTAVTAAILYDKGIHLEILYRVERLTHRKGESYVDYILRVKADHIATKVKIADIMVNLADEPTEQQIRKYARALQILIDEK